MRKKSPKNQNPHLKSQKADPLIDGNETLYNNELLGLVSTTISLAIVCAYSESDYTIIDFFGSTLECTAAIGVGIEDRKSVV